MEVNNLINWNSLTPEEQVLHLQQQNNEWSAAQAQKQMDFQREMSNTAHQREVEDLKAAGLNPVLSAKLGGASTPSGAMGSTDTSATSALVDLLILSMQTANSAAGAAYAAASDEGGFSLFGLRPGDYKYKNPRTPGQLAWNFGMDMLENLDVQVDAASIGAFAKSMKDKLQKQDQEQRAKKTAKGRTEYTEEDLRRVAHEAVQDWSSKKTVKERPSFYEEGAGQSAKSRTYKPNPKRSWYAVEDGKKYKKSKKISKVSGKTSAASLAGLTGLAGGIGMLGSGLGNLRYGSHPQLKF